MRVARVNCAECGGCGLLARNREHTMEFTTANHLGVRSGDEVILRVPSKRLSLTYLIVFGLPVLAMVAGYFLGAVIFGFFMEGGTQGPAILTAIALGLLSFWACLKLAERRGLSPIIVRVVGRPGLGEPEREGEAAGHEPADFKGRVL